VGLATATSFAARTVTRNLARRTKSAREDMRMVFKFPFEEWQRLISPDREEWQNPEDFIRTVNTNKEEIWADLGCGPGYFTLPLADKVKKVYAVDYERKMLEVCKHRAEAIGLKNIEYVVCTEENIPIASEEVHVSLIANLFHELLNPDAYLNEVKRITKPRGRIILIDWHPIPSPAGPPLEKRIAKEKALDFFLSKDFKQIDDLNIYPYHYFIVFERD